MPAAWYASMTERHAGLIALAVVVLAAPVTLAQARRGTASTPAAAARTEVAKMTCPQVLGQGVQSGRTFCDVVITRNPAEGIIVPVPAHTGAVTLTFDLHNRHTYSEELA